MSVHLTLDSEVQQKQDIFDSIKAAYRIANQVSTTKTEQLVA